MEEKLRTAFELLFEETTASTTELVKSTTELVESTTERLRNEKTTGSTLHHHHHHGTRIGTLHVVLVADCRLGPRFSSNSVFFLIKYERIHASPALPICRYSPLFSLFPTNTKIDAGANFRDGAQEKLTSLRIYFICDAENRLEGARSRPYRPERPILCHPSKRLPA